MADEEWISQREFAKRVGVSQPAVSKTIGRRIDAREDGKINWKTEEKKWYDNRDPSKIRDHNAPKDPNKPEEKKEEKTGAEPFAQAKLAKETFSANLLKLEYEERLGKLVNKDSVETAAFKRGRMVRDSILNIPDRVSAEIAAALIKDLKIKVDLPVVDRIVHHVFERETRAALSELSKELDV